MEPKTINEHQHTLDEMIQLADARTRANRARARHIEEGNNLKIYSIYDSKAGGYLPPFFQMNNAMAIRAFTAAANQEGSDFNRWAADYTLFCIGTFDQEKGRIEGHEHLENLGVALEYVNQKPTAPVGPRND